MQMTKKVLSIVLAVMMVVSMMSVMAVSTASAATNGDAFYLRGSWDVTGNSWNNHQIIAGADTQTIDASTQGSLTQYIPAGNYQFQILWGSDDYRGNVQNGTITDATTSDVIMYTNGGNTSFTATEDAFYTFTFKAQDSKISIAKTATPVAEVVGGTKYATLQEAINAAPANGTVKLLTDVTLSTAQTISGESNSYGATIFKNLTIDGNNKAITIASNIARGIGIKGTSGEIDVTLKDLTILQSRSGAMPVVTRGGIHSLTIDSCTIKTNGSSGGYVQPLTIGGSQSTTATVTVSDSTIQTSDDGDPHYAIILWNPVNLTVTDSTLKGWACVYAKSGAAGSDVTIDNSILVSKGVAGASSDNDFGLIVSEADDFDCVVINSTINMSSANDTLQGLAVPNDNSNVNIVFAAGNDVTMTGDNAVFTYNNDNGGAVVSGGTYNKPVPAEVAAPGLIPAELDPATNTYTVKEGWKVTFDPANGDDEWIECVDKGTTVAAPATDPTRADYNFAGWKLSGSAYDFDTPVTSDITLTADWTAKDYVAQVGSTKYESLQEAVDALGSTPGTVTLLADCGSGAKIYVNIAAGQDVTFDFGDYTFTSKWGFENHGKLTLTTNGTGGATAEKCIVDNYGELVVERGEYKTTGDETYVVWNNREQTPASSTTVNGGSLTNEGKDGWGIVVEGTGVSATINDGTVDGGENGYGISGIGNSYNAGYSITVNGGTVTGGDLGIYHPNQGTLTISGGTISGATGVYVKSGTTAVTPDATISGGTIKGTGAAAAYNFNGNGANSTGDAIVVDNCNYPGGAPTVTISGGTFDSAHGVEIGSYYGSTATELATVNATSNGIEIADDEKWVENTTTGGYDLVKKGLQDYADEAYGLSKTLDFVDQHNQSIDVKYKASLLGVQIRNNADGGYQYGDGSKALRFIAAVDNDIIAGASDYGFIITNTSNGKSLKKTCKGTQHNTILAGENDPNTTFFTAAVYNIQNLDQNLKVEFYIEKNGDTATAKYTKDNTDQHHITTNYNAVYALANRQDG